MDRETTKGLMGYSQGTHREKGVDAPPTGQQRTKLFPGMLYIGLIIENTLDATEMRNHDRCLDYFAWLNT